MIDFDLTLKHLLIVIMISLPEKSVVKVRRINHSKLVSFINRKSFYLMVKLEILRENNTPGKE